MGCSNETPVDKPSDKNKGYPLCRFTTSLKVEVNSILALNPNVLILGGENELLLFNLTTNDFSVISNEYKGNIYCLIKTPKGHVISGGHDKMIRIWDIENKKCINSLEGHTSTIWDIKYVGNDKLISGSDDDTSLIWDLKNNTHELLFKGKKHISSIVLLDNNKVLLAAGNNIILFDINTKEQLSVLDVSVWSLKLLKNGTVAAGLGKGILNILEITDEILVKLEFKKGHSKAVNLVIELENNKLVTYSDGNDDLILWDVNEPESTYMIKGHTKHVKGLCLIEGNKFASVSSDNTLKIWE